VIGEPVADDHVSRDPDREFAAVIVGDVRVLAGVWVLLLRPRDERFEKLLRLGGRQLDRDGAEFAAGRPVSQAIVHLRHFRIMPRQGSFRNTGPGARTEP
jgi:hypothetical protein